MKKKIIIFTSSGGSGHISATKAIQSYLNDSYESRPIYIFNEVFNCIDPTAVLTFGKINGEHIYNFFLRRRWYGILNIFYNIGTWYFGLQSKTMTRLAKQFLEEQKPDLVISVIPIINGVLLDATTLLNIPFLLLPTDMDVVTFIKGIDNPEPTKFSMTIAFDDPLVKAMVVPAHLNTQQIHTVGLPMRKDFFETKDKNALKKKYEIIDNKPVIVLMMGGQGNSNILAFARELSKLELGAHIIICLGKNSGVEEKIKKITFNSKVTVTILGYTERVSDLLAMADLLITKSGSVSFCEGIYMHIPMILDATATLLYWERLNHVLLIEHEWGISLTKISDINKAIITILGNSDNYQGIKKRLQEFPKPRPDILIPNLIEKILS